MEEARNAAVALAKLSNRPYQNSLPLYQLLVNGLEHGILEMTSEKKHEFHNQGHYAENINSMLREKNKPVTIKISGSNGSTQVSISDPGKGFDHSSYMKITYEKLLSPFGKQIAVAAGILKGMEYRDGGRTVTITL